MSWRCRQRPASSAAARPATVKSRILTTHRRKTTTNRLSSAGSTTYGGGTGFSLVTAPYFPYRIQRFESEAGVVIPWLDRSARSAGGNRLLARSLDATTHIQCDPGVRRATAGSG